jgi:hypothetical protein
MWQEAALVEGSRDQPRHDGEPCAGEQQRHGVPKAAPEPERAGRLSKKSTPAAGLKFRSSQNAVPRFGALPAVAIGCNAPRSVDIERNNFNELPDKFKAAAGAAFCGKISRARWCAASPAGSCRRCARAKQRRSRGGQTRAAARRAFPPLGPAADSPSTPAALSAGRGAPAAAASDWPLPQSALRARHRVARRGRVSRCTS